jgi:hypothetical protein
MPLATSSSIIASSASVKRVGTGVVMRNSMRDVERDDNAASAPMVCRSGYRRQVLKANAECPTCGRPIVVGADSSVGSMFGPMFAPRPPQELRAACAVHGRPPFNRRTLQLLQEHADDRDDAAD